MELWWCSSFGSPVCVLLPNRNVRVFSCPHLSALCVSLAVRTLPIASIFLSLQSFIFMGHPFIAAKASSAVIYIYGLTNSSYVWGAPSNQSSLINHDKAIKITSTILTASPDCTGFHINIFSFARVASISWLRTFTHASPHLYSIPACSGAGLPGTPWWPAAVNC